MTFGGAASYWMGWLLDERLAGDRVNYLSGWGLHRWVREAGK